MWIISSLLFSLVEYLAHVGNHTTSASCTSVIPFRHAQLACVGLAVLFAVVPTMSQLIVSVSILCSILVRMPNLKFVRVRADLQESLDGHAEGSRNRPIYGWGRTTLLWDYMFNTLHPKFVLSNKALVCAALPGFSTFSVN